MSGITPPSIVTYQQIVDISTYANYVNVSFPFKVRILDIWFTADAKMLTGTPPSGQVFDASARELRLAAFKSKSPRTVVSQYDPPSDWAPFFGTADPEAQTDYASADSSLKPYIWLGLPDDAVPASFGNATTHRSQTILGNAYVFRSTSSSAPALGSATNPYWGNDGWSSGQFATNKYKTDLAVMNPDEILVLSVYNDGGDWTDYENEGVATIHIAYEGIAVSTEPEDSRVLWTDWYND